MSLRRKRTPARVRFFVCEIFTVISLQDGVGWEISTLIWGNNRGPNIDSHEQQMRPELQDWLQF